MTPAFRLLACSVSAAACLLLTVVGAQQPQLWSAAREGRLEEVDRLLAQAADANAGGMVTVGDRPFRVSALGAAALGWHADVARTLLNRGARRPPYLVRNHNLVPFTVQELEALRDSEVVNSVLRMPDVAAVTCAIVERDAAGTYRTHDAREFQAALDAGGLTLRTPAGEVWRFQLDARTGARQYLERLQHGGSGFSASPVASDGRIYVASEDGEVFVVRAGPRFELPYQDPSSSRRDRPLTGRVPRHSPERV